MNLRYFCFIVLFLISSFSANALLLDDHPGAYAAYSLRQLDSNYAGPAIQVERSSDGSVQDIGFDANGDLDVSALTSFVGEGNGHIRVWYSQVEGVPDLVQSDTQKQPIIIREGTLITDDEGRPAIFFNGKSGDSIPDFLWVDNAPTILLNDYTMFVLVQNQQALDDGESTYASITKRGREHEGAAYRGPQSYVSTASIRLGGDLAIKERSIFTLRNTGSTADLWQDNTMVQRKNLASNPGLNDPVSATHYKAGGNFVGIMSEFIVYPSVQETELISIYKEMAGYWKTGPVDWNSEAILPQQFAYQVKLYDWMKTITVDDVALPSRSFTWDGYYGNIDELADLWILLEGATVSRVVRGEPDWYVLDAGNGKGIEATGKVRVWHEPGSGYGGNPPRSWSNEPAFLYQLDIPLANGGQGNPYFEDPVLCRRAMIVTATDMMMYHQAMLGGGYATWGDMYGKAMLGWAEAYRWCKDTLSPEVQQAFEDGFEFFLDEMINGDVSPRAVNTNMDMFAIQGAADLYMAADDMSIKNKAVQAVKRWLFGYIDGVLETKHKVFKLAGIDGGVFSPSGFIMEGDQPDVFYGGESIYHLVGALAAVTDRDTGNIPADWDFLPEVVRRSQEWRTFQMFYDPSGRGPAYSAGAGFSGRTGAAVPAGQAGEIWKNIGLSDLLPDAHHKGNNLPSVSRMKNDVDSRISFLTSKFSSTHTGTPNTWNGWSPWTKKTPYLPPEGWYSRITSLFDADDTSTLPPVAREGIYYNKPLGGDPVGYEYWAYKDTDGESEFGFFVEAQAKQGGYGGWYGGKVETFWTKDTGIVLINRHGKTGCDGGSEDSTCFNNIDYKAAHHVWGRDENGNAFTTLLLRGQKLQRTSTFDLDSSNPSVSVRNIFNDPSVSLTSSKSGEQTGSELEGSFEVVNSFEALQNGLRVSHQVVSDGSDELAELWASLPVYLRHYNPIRPGTDLQSNLDDTSIEYWDGTVWNVLPEDLDGNGLPEIVTTSALRLGRDFKLGDGVNYAYVVLDKERKVRLSSQVYYDPYQTKVGARTVHIDVHGNPGTVKTLSDASVSYDIVTSVSGLEQTIPSVLFNYPEWDQLVPAGGTWSIKTTTSWVDSPGSVIYQYSTDYAGSEEAATWNAIGVAQIEDGFEYFTGGTIPSGVRAIRAVLDEGGVVGTGIQQVSPGKLKLVVSDSFSSDRASLDGVSPEFSESGNNYEILRTGVLYSSDGAARSGDGGSWGNSVRVSTDNDDVLIRARLKYTGTSLSQIIGRVTDYHYYVGAGFNSGSFWIGKPWNFPGSKSTSFPAQLSKDYAVELQIIGEGATGVLVDEGIKVRSLSIFNFGQNGNKHGFRLKGSNVLDDLEIYSIVPDNSSEVSSDFADPIGGFGIGQNVVSISDTVVFGTGYWSIDGTNWIPFSFSGDDNVGSWIVGTASSSVDLSTAKFVVAYSCSYSGGWDCHGNKWQLRQI